MKRLFFFLATLIFFNACLDKKPKKEIKIENPFYTKAIKYRDNREKDSAFIYFNKAKDVFLVLQDSLNVGRCLVNMAIIATDFGDYFGGQEVSLNAISYFNQEKKEEHVYICSNFNNLGIANYKLKDYPNALKFNELAIKFASDSSWKYTYLNNRAKIYEELKDFRRAIQLYSQVIKGTTEDSINYARALANLASAKWLQNSLYNAAPDLLRALAINERQGELFGQNFCYARLSDFYSKKNNPDAINYAKKMYEVAKELNSPYDQLEALYKLVKLSRDKEAKSYFIAYEKLDDSLQSTRAMAKNQFALIRYDTIKLEKDNAENKYQLIRQETIIYIIIAIVSLSVIFSLFWYRKRKKGLQQEKELEVKKTELKFVKKVHDRVANQVYNVMMEVENSTDFDKTKLADKLESIYKISRDISYESNDINHKIFFAQQLLQLLKSYASDCTEIKVSGNAKELWIGLSESTKSEVFNVLQELMTNMKKHSQATIVSLEFEKKNNQIYITYFDNGNGIVGQLLYKNGLTNTGNRMSDINGTIKFDTEVVKGLKIEISFPIN